MLYTVLSYIDEVTSDNPAHFSLFIFLPFFFDVRNLCPQEVLAGPMLLIAVAGLLANLFAFWVLHRGVGEKNINIRAATLHILGDLLGSVGAIIAAVVIMMTGWMPVDPLLSILVSVLVLRSAWQLLKESFHELLEGAAQGVDTDALGKNLCLTIPEVSNVHHVHLWQLGEQQLMTLHVQASSPPKDHDDLLQRVQHYLLHHYKISHATVQIEYQPCEKSECDIHQTGVAGAHVHHH